MNQQENNLKNILSVIDDKNKISIKLPYSKENQTLKRYDIKSLTILSDIFSKDDTEEIILRYISFLIDIVQTRCTNDLNYVDYLYVIYCLREAENNMYENIDLKQLKNQIKNYQENLIEKETLTFINNDITYDVNYFIPTISRIKDILEECKYTNEDIIFYNTFKFIKNIVVKINEQTIDVSSAKELKQLYNVISYKALDEIGSTPSDITDKIYNLYKVNIETDTRFLFSI